MFIRIAVLLTLLAEMTLTHSESIYLYLKYTIRKELIQMFNFDVT